MSLPHQSLPDQEVRRNFEATDARAQVAENRLAAAEAALVIADARLDSLFATGTTFPTSPTDGDIFTILASPSAGVRWRFQYLSGGTYPWEFIGGAALVAQDLDARSLTNQTSYTDLPTDPMTITLPAIAGDFDIHVESLVTLPSGAGANFLSGHSYAVGATTASDDWGALTQSRYTSLGVSYTNSKRHRHTGVAASAVIAEKARTGGNYTVSWDSRRLEILPVRCSN